MLTKIKMQKIKNTILTSLLVICATITMAQETVVDYALVKERNPWLTADNAAALTTYSDTNVVKGGIFLEHNKGERGFYYDQSQANTFGAEAESFYRLSKKAVAFGSISYTNRTSNNVTGTAFMKTDDVHPFDIILDVPGRTVLESINIKGALGWNAWKNLSVGAAVDYTTANNAKQKDLRFASSYMNLNTNIGVSYDFGLCNVGASFLYRRNSESIAFSTYGTTDIVYTSLIDYANGMGIAETFNGDGFTNKTEQPLFSDYTGASVQLSVPMGKSLSVFAEGNYMRRKGYYGKESQFTLLYSKHESDCYGIRGRVAYEAKKSLHWLSMRMNVENMTAWRTTYTENTVDGVRSYHYYDLLKTANKVRAFGDISYTAHFTPLSAYANNGRTTLYAWIIKAGTSFDKRKQTAYVFPEQMTADHTQWTPYIDVTRNIMLRNSSIISAQLGAEQKSNFCNDGVRELLFPDKRFCMKVKVGYEFPIKKVKGLRPNVSVTYLSRYKTILGTLGVMYL